MFRCGPAPGPRPRAGTPGPPPCAACRAASRAACPPRFAAPPARARPRAGLPQQQPGGALGLSGRGPLREPPLLGAAAALGARRRLSPAQPPAASQHLPHLPPTPASHACLPRLPPTPASPACLPRTVSLAPPRRTTSPGPLSGPDVRPGAGRRPIAARQHPPRGHPWRARQAPIIDGRTGPDRALRGAASAPQVPWRASRPSQTPGERLVPDPRQAFVAPREPDGST